MTVALKKYRNQVLFERIRMIKKVFLRWMKAKLKFWNAFKIQNTPKMLNVCMLQLKERIKRKDSIQPVFHYLNYSLFRIVSLCDFQLFERVNSRWKRRYQTVDEIKENVTMLLTVNTKNDFADCFDNWDV